MTSSPINTSVHLTPVSPIMGDHPHIQDRNLCWICLKDFQDPSRGEMYGHPDQLIEEATFTTCLIHSKCMQALTSQSSAICRCRSSIKIEPRFLNQTLSYFPEESASHLILEKMRDLAEFSVSFGIRSLGISILLNVYKTTCLGKENPTINLLALTSILLSKAYVMSPFIAHFHQIFQAQYNKLSSSHLISTKDICVYRTMTALATAGTLLVGDKLLREKITKGSSAEALREISVSAFILGIFLELNCSRKHISKFFSDTFASKERLALPLESDKTLSIEEFEKIKSKNAIHILPRESLKLVGNFLEPKDRRRFFSRTSRYLRALSQRHLFETSQQSAPQEHASLLLSWIEQDLQKLGCEKHLIQHSLQRILRSSLTQAQDMLVELLFSIKNPHQLTVENFTKTSLNIFFRNPSFVEKFDAILKAIQESIPQRKEQMLIDIAKESDTQLGALFAIGKNTDLNSQARVEFVQQIPEKQYDFENIMRNISIVAGLAFVGVSSAYIVRSMRKKY